MARPHLTPGLARTEEAVIMLFCIVDDAYHAFNPRAQRYESLKRLSDSEVLTLALLQQLRGVESNNMTPPLHGGSQGFESPRLHL
jgi:hypothetical protein